MKRLLFALVTMTLAVVGPAEAQIKVNPNQVGILHWYKANQTTTVGVGTVPSGMAFDGACIWVTYGGSNTISKL